MSTESLIEIGLLKMHFLTLDIKKDREAFFESKLKQLQFNWIQHHSNHSNTNAKITLLIMLALRQDVDCVCAICVARQNLVKKHW